MHLKDNGWNMVLSKNYSNKLNKGRKIMRNYKFIPLAALLIFAVKPSSAQSNKDCLGSTNCATQQKQVEAAMEGLSVAKQYNYCRLPGPEDKNGVGLQCRTFTLYKNQDGEITLDFFKFQFIAAEVHRDQLVDTYYVKQKDGTYNSFHDEIADGVLEIDKQKEDWIGVNITFNKNFPSYTTAFTTATGVPGEPPIVRLASIQYDEFGVTLINDVDKPRDEQSRIIYQMLGTVQRPKE